MRRKLKWFHIATLIFLAALGLRSLIYFVPRYLESERIRKDLIAQKIYEVDFTYSIVHKKSVAYYMVCEPPNNQQDLTEMIKSFLTEDRLAELRVRSREYVDTLIEEDHKNRPLDGMMLIFIEPYKELGIGVFPKPDTILDYHPEGHTLAFAYSDITQPGTLEIHPAR